MKKLKKRTRKILFTTEITFSVIVLLYIFILFFPQFAFTNKFEYKNFTIHYQNQGISKEDIKSVLDKSIELLSQSELFNSEFKQKIYVCNTYAQFFFFAPGSRTAFGTNYPLSQNIILTKSSFADNLIVRNGNDNNKRTLSGAIAHESTHSLLENKLGLVKYKLFPKWKNEGYCEFISKESSYNEEIGMEVICNNINESSPSFQYFKYRLYATYLFQEKKITLNSFIHDDFDTDILYDEIKNTYCK
ncbi:MAG: hypothetical protein LBH82_02490 [Bacteroidales bacterium]|jgi:hypothetical protein|nr:hypothetical protein [Bacteroidales bacterium]